MSTIIYTYPDEVALQWKQQRDECLDLLRQIDRESSFYPGEPMSMGLILDMHRLFVKIAKQENDKYNE